MTSKTDCPLPAALPAPPQHRHRAVVSAAMTIRTLTLTALIALTAAAPAAASTASVSGGVLTVTAATGEENDLGIEQRNDGYFLQDNTSPVTPGAGCSVGTDQYGNKGALCNGVTSIAVDLDDRDDLLRPIGKLAAPLSFAGGSGFDIILYIGSGMALQLSNDGAANDGPSGKDNIAGDVEQLFGTPFADKLQTGPTGGDLWAGDGDDTLTGGSGNDMIRAAYVEDVGVDAGAFYSQGKDVVNCGGGQDVVLSDHDDTVAGDCEVVAVDNFGSSGNGGYLVTGSSHGDVIGPLPYGWGPATVRARGGNDTIRTAEVQRVYAGSGSDRIIGFDQASQKFWGETGRDRIDVRDKKPAKFNRDTVRCGKGRDLVYANRNDRVSRDCERVKRS